MLKYQNNAAAMDSFLVCIRSLTKFFLIFEYLKAYYEILSKQDMGQPLMLMTSDIPPYDLTGLNVKILDEPLSRRILHEDIGPIYGKLKQIHAYT